jgi:hypothetical protein
MTTVLNLREHCREPWDAVPDFPFEVKSVQGGKVWLKVKNTDKRCAELYQTFQDITGEFDAAAWLPIFEAAAAKCREVVLGKDDDTAELPALPDHHHAT